MRPDLRHRMIVSRHNDGLTSLYSPQNLRKMGLGFMYAQLLTIPSSPSSPKINVPSNSEMGTY